MLRSVGVRVDEGAPAPAGYKGTVVEWRLHYSNPLTFEQLTALLRQAADLGPRERAALFARVRIAADPRIIHALVDARPPSATSPDTLLEFGGLCIAALRRTRARKLPKDDPFSASEEVDRRKLATVALNILVERVVGRTVTARVWMQCLRYAGDLHETVSDVLIAQDFAEDVQRLRREIAATLRGVVATSNAPASPDLLRLACLIADEGVCDVLLACLDDWSSLRARVERNAVRTDLEILRTITLAVVEKGGGAQHGALVGWLGRYRRLGDVEEDRVLLAAAQLLEDRGDIDDEGRQNVLRIVGSLESGIRNGER